MIQKINNILYWIIAGLAGCICFFLFAQSLFTDIKTDEIEKAYIVASNKFVTIICILFLLMLFYQWHRHIVLPDKAIRWIIVGMSAANCLFVFGSQNFPRADQLRILKFATEIWQGNYESFYPGNYMDMCPHQNGIVLFAYILCVVCGGYNFLFFQFLNALAVDFTYYKIYKFWKKYGRENRFDEIMIGISIFCPITFTVNFVYGTMIGLAFSVWAILHQQAYLKDRNRKDLVLSIVFAALAYVFKSNYMIFVIGMVLVYLYDAVVNKVKESIIGIIGMFLCVIMFSGMVDKSMSIITHGSSDRVQGIPAVAYVVMGLRDGKYSGYNWDIYWENDNNSDKTTQACLEDLKTTIEQRLDNPKETIKFFQQKIADMWCEPSFGGFLNNRIDYQTVLQGHSTIYNETFANSGRLHRILALFLEAYQSIIYFGVVLYLWCSRKDKNVALSAGIIIFLGGFIFHFFWESKASYGLPYFVILIPYAITGFEKCFDKLYSDKGNLCRRKNICKLLAISIVSVAAGNLLIIDRDGSAWNTYFREHRFISDGYYYLKPMDYEGVCEYVEGEGICIVENKSQEDKLYLSLDTSDTWQYQFDDMSRENRLAVVEDHICMVSDEENIFPSDAFWFWKWRIERTGGGYCIRWWYDMNKVMTFDEQTMTVYLSDYEDGNRAQIWKLTKR